MTNPDVKELARKLLPCPFCGGNAATFDTRTGHGWSVGCGDCGADILRVEHAKLDSEQVAIAAWNTRCETPPIISQDTPETSDKDLRIKELETILKHAQKVLACCEIVSGEGIHMDVLRGSIAVALAPTTSGEGDIFGMVVKVDKSLPPGTVQIRKNGKRLAEIPTPPTSETPAGEK